MDVRGAALRDLLYVEAYARPHQFYALRRAAMYPRTIVIMPTGTGKTLVGLGYAFYRIASGDADHVIVAAPTLLIAEQWYRSAKAIEEATGGRVGVCLVTGEVKRVEEPCRVTVTTYSYLARHPDLVDERTALVIDEVHHVREDAWRSLADIAAEAPFVLGLTGMNEAYIMERGTDKVLGAVVIPSYVKLASKVIAPPLVVVEAKVLSPDRVVSDVEKLREAGYKKIIVLANKVSEAEEIAKALEDAGLRVVKVYGSSYMPKNVALENVRRFERGEADVAVASPVIIEGVDIPAADAVVAVNVSSERVVTQLLGRVARTGAAKKWPVAILHGNPAELRRIVSKLEERGLALETSMEEVAGAGFVPPARVRTAALKRLLERIGRIDLSGSEAEEAARLSLALDLPNTGEKLDLMAKYALMYEGRHGFRTDVVKRSRVILLPMYVRQPLMVRKWWINPASVDVSRVDDASREAIARANRILGVEAASAGVA